MDNSSNVSLSIESADLELDPVTIIFAICIELISLPGLLAYLMVVLIILRNRKTFANAPYYTLLLSLAFSDIVQILFNIFYFVPSLLLQRPIFGFIFDWISGALCYLICYYAGMASMVLIAVNRFFGVCRFHSHKTVFRINRTRLYVVAMWVFGTLWGIFQLFPGFGFSYMNGPDMNAPGNKYFFVWLDRFFTAFVITALVVCYVAIILKRTNQISETVRNALDRQSRVRREKTERNLALQFGIIVLLLLLYLCSAQIMIIEQSLFSYFLANFLFVDFVSLNPFVYIAFNSDIRKQFLRMFCCKHHMNTIVNSHNISMTTRRERQNPGERS